MNFNRAKRRASDLEPEAAAGVERKSRIHGAPAEYCKLTKRMRIPDHLARSPLVEATFEMRFDAAPRKVPELFAGLLIPRLGGDFSIEATPLGLVPAEVRAQHPELKYAAHLKARDERSVVLLGPNVLARSWSSPYPGWHEMRLECERLINVLHDSGYVGTLHRFSLKYLNLLDPSGQSPLGPFRIQVDPASLAVAPTGFALRFETDESGFRSIVELKTDAVITTDDQKREGTLFSVDSICESVTEAFWHESLHHLDSLHAVLEGLFFRLLTPETIKTMEPSWPQA